MTVPERASQRGFSLLEMVVAMAILGLALGALYQASSAATRNVRTDERYAYAVELARSLVADSAIVPAEGLRSQGETDGGFRWELRAEPLSRPRDSRLTPGMLQELAVEVSWVDGDKRRRVRLHSVVEGQRLDGRRR
ncbi:type IV pilus modification PilV family protein [Pseudohaliea rubra]|uniref:General secretion pathway protein I n=1 Tax=Pseudohaliea rubra DSM 19751 TaxID=1265313 RepID=A0A095X1K4_9GAMM|nr:prepilin-type N-terminal cleavage/methylation domain-containing protein [Pseudohaliea rubra]KGE04744.1 General secretion pathway protein I [Pseudohaliea rubra DSM 19751]